MNSEKTVKALEKFSEVGIIPVVVLNDAKNAEPLGKALMEGGLPAAEVTFRTDAAEESIRIMAEKFPDMLVGAGTVLTIEQVDRAVAAGAKFIVSPGFDPEVVQWCIDNGIAVTPGCVTPSEIMAAMKLGLNVIKFFPAGVYGGLSAMKALAGPFVDIKFIPTGGANAQNIGEYAAAPFIHAVGGSWVCPKKEIEAGNFEKITALCKEAKQAALGFEVAHIGINCPDGNASMALCKDLEAAFDFAVKPGNSSNFSTSAIEVMKSDYLGANGHIAIRTNNIAMAVAELEKKGYKVLDDTAKFKADRMIAIYLEKEFGGFAIHLLQK